MREPIRLTEKQVENWRKVLAITYGARALLMPREVIQELYEDAQEKINKAEAIREKVTE